MDKWSPTNLEPPSVCLGGQSPGIQKYKYWIGCGPFVQGNQILGDHLSMGTCSSVVKVHWKALDNNFSNNFSWDSLRGSRNTSTELVVDHLFRGTKFWGTICPWGPNLIGTICPGGTILWGSFVQEDRKWGTGSLGIKWIWDQMRLSHTWS